MSSERAKIVSELHEVFERITDGRVDVASLDESSTIMDDLGLDSLDLLELRFEFESLWNVTINEDEVGSLQTVGDVVDFILAHKSEPGSTGHA